MSKTVFIDESYSRNVLSLFIYFLLWAIFYFRDRNRRKIPTRQIKLTSQKASIVAQVLNCLFISFLFAATSNSE